MKGFIDKTGKEIIPPKYDLVWNYKEGLARVKLNDLIGFIGKNGNIVIPIKYEYALNFFDGLAVIVPKIEYGYMKRAIFIPVLYREALDGDTPSHAYKFLDKFGYIDKTGKEYWKD